MHKNNDFTKLGGLHVYQDTLADMQDTYSMDADAVAAFIGEHYVISGCVDDGVNVSNGWIVVAGEKIPLVGAAKTAWLCMEDIVGDESYDDGNLKPFYYTRRAKFGVASTGPDDFLYADLKRLPYGATSIGEYATLINKMLQGILQKEAEVILDGCLVTNITTGPDTCDISAGLVLFNAKLVQTPAYSGAYPAYLKADGNWVTAVPGAGLYITFEPHTSQRYINVLDRALTDVGEIKMFKTLSDRFDTGTGLGKWDKKGYKLMYSMQSRVPVGLWFDGVAVADVTDANHTAANNAGGKKAETLLQNNLPATMTFDINLVPHTGTGAPKGVTDGPSSSGNTPVALNNAGGGQPLNNQQPYRIIVYAERI